VAGAPPPGSLVCVTGGLGFIGTHLTRALLARGHRVRCVDNLRGRYSPASGRDAADSLAAMGVEVVRADVRRAPLEALLGGADAVVHLAALPGVRSRHTLGELWEQNVEATERLVRGAARRGIRLVLASSSSVYGDAARLPTPERTPPSPLSLYAVSKLAAENVCRTAGRDLGADAVIVRLFTVFGPGQRPDMALARWIERIRRRLPLPWHVHRGGRRELTYVDDAVRGLLAALERGEPGQQYNIAGCGSIPLDEVVRQLESVTGRTAALSPRVPGAGEAVATEACRVKAALELGYRPRTSFEEGIRRQVEAAAATTA
jgi:UDP-glucuronate 4-epimerase